MSLRSAVNLIRNPLTFILQVRTITKNHSLPTTYTNRDNLLTIMDTPGYSHFVCMLEYRNGSMKRRVIGCSSAVNKRGLKHRARKYRGKKLV